MNVIFMDMMEIEILMELDHILTSAWTTSMNLIPNFYHLTHT